MMKLYNLRILIILQEIESLAKQIGIDYETEKKKYFWFLVQANYLLFFENLGFKPRITSRLAESG